MTHARMPAHETHIQTYSFVHGHMTADRGDVVELLVSTQTQQSSRHAILEEKPFRCRIIPSELSKFC
ncbi:predicted protein [Plenodomus lingam JN3]|uniref:Predicted protein n=1 Tax=Leptosphaeria maculans (strain JN3 / isolate v23.1.3 / race Av1-4-5-6-7-8) TaxID=985895 RepID=E4ZP21_LEPMJ|nr:predicted protein [Plenodomus lingam JN3]CBX93390.1 predicted protein [Plenodomus lingam JN3]